MDGECCKSMRARLTSSPPLSFRPLCCHCRALSWDHSKGLTTVRLHVRQCKNDIILWTPRSYQFHVPRRARKIVDPPFSKVCCLKRHADSRRRFDPSSRRRSRLLLVLHRLLEIQKPPIFCLVELISKLCIMCIEIEQLFHLSAIRFVFYYFVGMRWHLKDNRQ